MIIISFMTYFFFILKGMIRLALALKVFRYQGMVDLGRQNIFRLIELTALLSILVLQNVYRRTLMIQ